ncbi:UDP-N-acetylglucosamine 2-epimerase (non-hydrolyzing) [Nonomuraea sp. NPDC049625]|uniref:non-hydrolyzing UDP-N-acetylglucosamine 2-epimerase n=1 Tax=Nonomuraea sp. NPDC049625 TaxID=3155775 RepID=UPI003430A778
MKIVSIVGARPQFVKLAPVAAVLSDSIHEHVIVHTGQHYDVRLSDAFFTGLAIPAPKVNLGVGSASHGVQTGAILAALDPILSRERPDCVLVYGDTNSTLAGALSAVKQQVPVAHLEAGLRSFNRRMAEEHNRVLTDHSADLLLAPTRKALRHLAAEGLAARSVLVGDVMADICMQIREMVLANEGPGLPDGVTSTSPYLLATLHRAENTDAPERLARLVAALGRLPVQVVLLAHPRLLARASEHGVQLAFGAIHVERPLSYSSMVAAVLGSAGVITDSGGLQKEAYLLERPCTTLRSETEWTETLANGWNVLVPDPDKLEGPEWAAIATRPAPATRPGAHYGDGCAARRVVHALERHVA